MRFALSLVFLLSAGTAAFAEDLQLAPMALNSLSKPPANLTSASVMDQRARVVGTFQGLVTDQDGKPAAISYVTPDGKLVVVAAQAVSYDAQRNILVTADNPQFLASR